MSQTNHFDSIAEVFNRIWYFSDDYKDFVIRHILEDLSLSPEDILVDIGGGTGTFTSRLANEANLTKAYCVEPSSSMCIEAKKLENITAVCCDAHDFLASHTPFSKILFKEVIHHIPMRAEFWKILYDSLQSGGKILIITRPQKIDFPFFEAAKVEFARNQPPFTLVETELKACGFEVKITPRNHTFTLAKESWYEMLRHRFMSDLGIFSDEEIEEGILEIEAHEKGNETLDIIDNLIFITATK
jgi:ubiquinone/menaquinone biosynthesis C-methylase UbiE